VTTGHTVKNNKMFMGRLPHWKSVGSTSSTIGGPDPMESEGEFYLILAEIHVHIVCQIEDYLAFNLPPFSSDLERNWKLVRLR
jgi:hypothetical protein